MNFKPLYRYSKTSGGAYAQNIEGGILKTH